MEPLNLQIIQTLLGSDDPKHRTKFAPKYNIHVEDISTFKLPGYNVLWLKVKLSDVIDEFFPRIHDARLATIPTVHTSLPEPNRSEFFTTDKPDPAIKFNYGFDFDFLRTNNTNLKYTYDVYDVQESDLLGKHGYDTYGNIFRVLI